MEIHVNTYGTSLKVKNGLLRIRNKEDVVEVPMGKISTIVLTRGIYISSDVFYQCIENGVDVLITERSGFPVGRVWNNKFGSISTIRKIQIEYSKSSRVIPWAINNIKEKIENQKELLLTFFSLDEPYEQLIYKTNEELSTISSRLELCIGREEKEAIGRIRALEGQCAKKYFSCINQHLPNRYQFARRSRRPAEDITNSMLNYCYGILYGHIESALIKAGLDPYIGFFHRDEYNRPVLTYDVIEPFRPWSDWVVINLCLNEVIDETFFDVSDGGYWLLSDGRRILIQHFADFFEEVIEYDNLHFSRYTIMEKRAQQLVNEIKDSLKDE